MIHQSSELGALVLFMMDNPWPGDLQWWILIHQLWHQPAVTLILLITTTFNPLRVSIYYPIRAGFRTRGQLKKYVRLLHICDILWICHPDFTFNLCFVLFVCKKPTDMKKRTPPKDCSLGESLKPIKMWPDSGPQPEATLDTSLCWDEITWQWYILQEMPLKSIDNIILTPFTAWFSRHSITLIFCHIK